jgi:hypothetical protein
MKTLVGIVNCHSRAVYQQAVRETWVPHTPQGLDYKFFLGPCGHRSPKEDEVFLDCDDSYGGLPSKVRAMCKWALDHGFDHMVKLDDDVVFKPKMFLHTGYQNYDFTGNLNEDRSPVAIPWGFCYVLSKRSMEIMAAAQLPGNHNDEAWVSHTLNSHGIVLHREPRFYLHRGNRSELMPRSPRPLRAPRRDRPMDEITPQDGIAYCVFLHWSGFHCTPDDVNIKEYHRLYKEMAQ